MSEAWEKAFSPFRPRTVRIEADGTWTYGGETIVHREVLKLFKRSLRPARGSGWELRLSEQIWPVEVRDTPFFVTAVRPRGEGEYEIRLDDGSAEVLDPGTLASDSRGFKTSVKGGAFPARFLRTAYIDIAHCLEVGSGGRLLLPVRGGDPVDLGPVED